MQHDLLFVIDNNGIQSPYPDDWAHHQSSTSWTWLTAMHHTHLLSGSQTIFLSRSLYVYSQSIASTSNTAFWWVLHMQTEWVSDDPARTHHFGLRVQKLENLIFMLGYLSLNVLYNSGRLHTTNCFCLCTFQLILT